MKFWRVKKMTKRLKKIGTSERAARAELKKLGISEHDLIRFYDANYKAKQRAAALNRQTGESLNINWKSILQGAKQNIKQGKTAVDYLKTKTAALKERYKLSTAKAEATRVIIGVDNGDWGAELVKKQINKLSAVETENLYSEVLNDMEEAGEQLPAPSAETYKRAHKRYIDENAATYEEWGKILHEEQAGELGFNDTMLFYAGRILGVDLDAIRAEQEEAESDAQRIEESKRAAYLAKRKREIFREYAPAEL